MSNINNKITGSLSQITSYDISTGNITDLNTSNLQVRLGNISNIFIFGGANSQVLTTNGAGNLSFANRVAGANTQVQFNASGIEGASPNFTFDTANAANGLRVLSGFTANPGAHIIQVQGLSATMGSVADGGVTVANATTTINTPTANITSSAITLGNSSGSGTSYVTVNANGVSLGQAGGQVISAGGSGISIGGTGGVTIQGTLGANVTLGGGTGGNIDVVNPINLGPVANVHITGGTTGQALTTDGTGNLIFSTVTATASGANGTVQFANGTGGQLDSDGANFVYSKANSVLTAVNFVSTNATMTTANVLTVNAANVNANAAAVTGNLSAGNLSVSGATTLTGNVTANSNVTVNGTLNATTFGNITTTLVNTDISRANNVGVTGVFQNITASVPAGPATTQTLGWGSATSASFQPGSLQLSSFAGIWTYSGTNTATYIVTLKMYTTGSAATGDYSVILRKAVVGVGNTDLVAALNTRQGVGGTSYITFSTTITLGSSSTDSFSIILTNNGSAITLPTDSDNAILSITRIR